MAVEVSKAMVTGLDSNTLDARRVGVYIYIYIYIYISTKAKAPPALFFFAKMSVNSICGTRGEPGGIYFFAEVGASCSCTAIDAQAGLGQAPRGDFF